MKRLLAVALLCLAGCGTTPYGEIGVGYQIDSRSDWYLRTEREYQCSNPQAHFEAGLEKGRVRVGYHHQSWFRCGGPFNDRAELYVDDIRVTYKIGGEK
jgi:hypothetical protein